MKRGGFDHNNFYAAQFYGRVGYQRRTVHAVTAARGRNIDSAAPIDARAVT
jgi:hypothetical protein